MAWPRPIGGRQHGDDVGAAVGVGVAQLGVEGAGVADEVAGAVDARARRSRGAEPIGDGPRVGGAVDEVNPRPRGVVRGDHPGRP